MTRRVRVPRAVSGYGYVGVWNKPADTIGWQLPECIHPDDTRQNPQPPNDYVVWAGRVKRVFLCKIVITPIRDRRGQPVTRLVGGQYED